MQLARPSRRVGGALVTVNKRLLLVGPAVGAFVWWLLKHGPDVDAWSFEDKRGADS
jgi:hypothetical protein